MSVHSKYDAIIVGARIAGTATAVFLAQSGFHVLLLDRVHFPKTTLSCPVYFGNALDLLERIGALQQIEALGAPKIRLYQATIGDIILRGRLLPSHGYDYAYSLRREAADERLFQSISARPGIETRLDFNVEGLVWDGDASVEQDHARVIGVKGGSGGRSSETIYADLVVGADGIFSRVARETRAARYHIQAPGTCVYYAYFSNVLRAGGEPSLTSYFVQDEHIAAITSDAGNGETVVSLSLPAARFEMARRAPEQVHTQSIRLIPDLAARMERAVRVSPIYGVSPRESFYRVPFGPGWALVGDAGYYKDPITGQGIYDALRAAELLAQAYVHYRNGKDWTRVMRAYQRIRDQETAGMNRLTNIYAHLERTIPPQEWELLRAIAASPLWSNRYSSLFNGATDASDFIKTRTALRIYWGWKLQGLWQRIRGSKPRQESQAQS